MADFSFPCLSTSFLDSNWLPDFPNSVLPSSSGFAGDLGNSFFSCYSSDPHHDIAPDVTIDGKSCSENKYRMISSGGDIRESSVIEPQSFDQVTLKEAQMEKVKKTNEQFKDVTQGKDKKRKHNIDTPTDYVHVRARRGEATDKHSIAERARREKISKKMKQLQALVPGCDQMNSKELVLNAIINHVQSLQNQVEYLSELLSMNHMQYGLGEDMDDFMKFGSLAEDAAAIITTPSNNYPTMDSTVCLSLQKRQRPIVICEDKAGLFIGDVEDQKQMSITRSSPGFDNSCNF